MVEEGLGEGISFVAEGLSGGRRAVFGSRETSIDVSKSQGDAAFVGIDDILECGLRAAREGRQFEVMFNLRLWGSGGVKGSSFAKGHGCLNCRTA
jgi:hypothetical protein